MLIHKKILVLIASLSFSLMAHATSTPVADATKTYTLTQLHQVVSNHKECSAFYKELKQLTKNPVTLQFTPASKSQIAAQDSSGQINNHSHSIMNQEVNGGIVNRTISGNFTMKDQQIDYAAAISAHPNNPDHKYIYPILLASHNAQCYYTALVNPSDETVAAFKKSIQAGHAAKGTDIHQK